VWVLGLDVGGTTIKSGLVNPRGELRELRRTATPQQDFEGDELVKTLVSLVETYRELNPEIAAVGLSVPGVVDAENGIAVFSETLGWHDLPLAKRVSDAVKLPVKLVHDVTVGGLAELRVGAAKGYKSAIVIIIGTGLAACLIFDGKVYRPHATVGEIGHGPTRNNRPCPCGKSGCLEMTSSGGALVRNYFAATGETIAAHEVIARAEVGDKVAAELWQEFLDEFCNTVHFLVSTLGPDLLVIAGGFGALGPKIIDPIERHLDRVIAIPHRPKVVTSNLEGSSGCIGAGLSVIEQLGLD
jgi:glucokinase